MQIIIYITAFIIGALLGSFCTLAVYRIPLKQNITNERSYCVKCNHKLKFLDLIPILSYLMLGGKCRYCGEKIRVRYIIIEICFGLSYMLFIMSLKINPYILDIEKIFYILFSSIYLVVLFLVAGIDKEYNKIHKSVMLFGIISTSIYMLYLYIVGDSMYRYEIYLLITAILFFIQHINPNKRNYSLEVLSLISFMLIYTKEIVMVYTIIAKIAVYIIVKLIKKEKKISIGFILCTLNILLNILNNFIMIGA